MSRRCQGCDASVLLASPHSKAEKDSPDDISLAGDGFDTIIKAKTAIDRDPRCQNKVSCAAILAMATRDVVALAGGPFYQVELGRLYGIISTKGSARHHLPQPTLNSDHLNAMFTSHGLSQTDMTTLSGAHTIGLSHYRQFAKRVYCFRRGRSIDPTLNRNYARQLRQMRPINVDPRIAINMDPTTPQRFDKAYFKNLQSVMCLFTSDQSLFTDVRLRNTVKHFAKNNTAFYHAFVEGWESRLGIKGRSDMITPL